MVTWVTSAKRGNWGAVGGDYRSCGLGWNLRLVECEGRHEELGHGLTSMERCPSCHLMAWNPPRDGHDKSASGRRRSTIERS
jgi:hypothetical protein